jgi:hypothetical protein
MNSSDQPKRGLKFSGAPPYAQSSERIREAFANQGIAGARLTGRDVTDDQIYREVGYGDANEYWRVVLSEPMEISSFVHLLKSYFFNPALDGLDQYQLEIDAALRLASDIGEPWFIKVPNKEIMVHPRKAAEWLLSMPKSRHLLPPGLVDFLESSERQPAQEVPLKADMPLAPPRARKRGPKTGVLNRVASEMRETLKRQEMTTEQLETMIEKSLQARFKASRESCRKAREIVLSEFVGI